VLVRCIIVQRTSRYPGEYAPELWDAWSEYRSGYLRGRYDESLAQAHLLVATEFDAVRELDVVISEGVIADLFRVPTTVANINRNPTN
jgi:hypothetical protein